MTTFETTPVRRVTNYELAAEFLRVQLPDGVDTADADYASAFQAWEEAIGADHVRRDDATRTEYAKTTLPRGTHPAGVVRPGTREEVCQVVQIAHRFGVRLHAISRGKNWGYGDACASTDGQVIVELTRMNRIHEINVELGYAVIEPGVSQGQMYEYLRDNEIPLLFDATGAGPDASIVGNILQRGSGHSPYGDRFRHTCGFEVVLPDGRLLNTGFGQFENAKAAQVYPWGAGPWVDGLFTQSNLGIVTSACVWLMPRPEAIEGFAFMITEEKLGDAVEAVRRLRMNGTLRSVIHIANDLRVLSSRMQYPWDRTQGQTPLDHELRMALQREQGLKDWNAVGGLYGTRTEVRAYRRVVARELRGIARVRFFDRRKINLAARITRHLSTIPMMKRLQRAVQSVSSVFDLLEGIPSSEHLTGVYWRAKPALDTAALDCRDTGLIWISPVLPTTREAVATVTNLVTDACRSDGFDPLITFSSVTDRAMVCVLSINYDRECGDETERARSCTQTVKSQLADAGYYPYRIASV